MRVVFLFHVLSLNELTYFHCDEGWTVLQVKVSSHYGNLL